MRFWLLKAYLSAGCLGNLVLIPKSTGTLFFHWCCDALSIASRLRAPSNSEFAVGFAEEATTTDKALEDFNNHVGLKTIWWRGSSRLTKDIRRLIQSLFPLMITLESMELRG
jgi:hypothetical protein